MSMTSRWFEKRVSRLAYELADNTDKGPTPEVREGFENRLWEAFERKPKILERLEKHFNIDPMNRDYLHIADVTTPGMVGIADAITESLAIAI